MPVNQQILDAGLLIMTELEVFEDESRRSFLQQVSSASAAALTMGAPSVFADESEKVEQPRPTADACIILWMAGGMAAPETFDPKHYEPFQEGLEVEKIISTFPRHRHVRRWPADFGRAGERCSGDGPRDIDPFGVSG